MIDWVTGCCVGMIDWLTGCCVGMIDWLTGVLCRNDRLVDGGVVSE